MKYQPNIGQSFPLESLSSDIARNSFNYQSILNALIEWNVTTESSVMVRLSKDSAPWYEDFEIPSKKSIAINNDITSVINGSVKPSAFAIPSLLNVAAYGGTHGDSSDPGDVLTIRSSITDSGTVQWLMYYAPIIHTWVSGINVRSLNYYRHSGIVYIANYTGVSNVTPDLDIASFMPAIKAWVKKSKYELDDYVSYKNNLYITTVPIANSYNAPDDRDSGFTLVASAYDSVTDYHPGILVYANNSIYISLKQVSGVDVYNAESWRELFVRRITQISAFNDTHVDRYDVMVDTQAIIVRNASIDVYSTPTTSMVFQPSIQTRGNPSIYQRSTGVYSTCNYVSYPRDMSAMWSESAPIDHTDTTLDITKRQDYSAVWVMDHTNQTDSRTISFINYDGPDLDQGLCIYLPIEVDLSNGQIAEPEDGYTFELYMRIWPNTKLTTNTVTRDHIVNKSQIYVYSAFNKESIIKNQCSYPIAKFSMSRMSNFHVFGENITIPDKPVVYRATFMYLSAHKAWSMLDYYQLPDHVFVGPIGFIDPSNPGNADIAINGMNPNAAHIGYETSALPTYVDVFSQPNLSPYRSSDGSFFNRSI